MACATTEISKKTMVEDLGSPDKIELLRQRANDFWSAFVRKDYERVYNLYDPFFRARTSKNAFIGTMGRVLYHEYEIKDIKVEGNVAKVKVRVVYSMPKYRFRQLELSKPKTPAEFEENWLYIYDNWYKEFYMYSLERGLIYY